MSRGDFTIGRFTGSRLDLCPVKMQRPQHGIDRTFANFRATPFSRTVPVIDGGVEVPKGPGLGADPEDDLIAQFRV